MVFITRKNILKLISEIVLLVAFIIFAIFYPNQLIQFFNMPLYFFKTYHLIWFVIVLVILKDLFIPPKKEISHGKMFSKYYQPNKKRSSKQLKKSLNKLTKKFNRKALNSAIFSLSLLAIFLLAYFIFNLDKIWAYLYIAFLMFFDSFCITLWCPFRDWLIKIDAVILAE